MNRTLRAGSALFLALLLTFSQNVWAMNPFEKNHPLVQQGLDAYDAGRYDEALKYFDEAKKQLPTSAPVEFNRGNALYKLGRLDEAKAAYESVEKMDKSELKASDYYNMGNTYARLGDDKAAIKQFRNALKLNPKDAEARHNMEVLMRKLPPPPQQGQDGGTPDSGSSDGGQQKDGGTPKPMDGGSDAGTDGGSRPDGGSGDAGQGDGGADGGSDGGADGGTGDGGQGDAGQAGDGGSDGGADGGEGDGKGKGDNSKDGGTDGGEPSELSPDGQTDGGMELLPDGGVQGMSKDEAEKLLDAMKQNEKNLQLWKFQQKKPRQQNEKDW